MSEERLPTHEGSASHRLSKQIRLIHTCHQGSNRLDYPGVLLDLLGDLRSLLDEEYQWLEPHEVDAIIDGVKCSDKLSLSELLHKVTDVMMMHDQYIRQQDEMRQAWMNRIAELDERLWVTSAKHDSDSYVGKLQLFIESLEDCLSEYPSSEVNGYLWDKGEILKFAKYQINISRGDLLNAVLNNMRIEPQPEPSKPQPEPSKPPPTNEGGRQGDEGKQEDRLQVFRDMNLMPTEVTINLVGNNRIRIERDDKEKFKGNVQSRGVSYSDFCMIDGRDGVKLNKEGKLLIGLAEGKRLPIKGTKEWVAYYSAIKGVRKIFKTELGITANPFSKDGKPHFTIKDLRNSADLRAKQKALRAQKTLKRQQEARSKQDDNDKTSPYDPENHSASARSKNAPPEIDLTALLNEGLNSGEIPQDEYDQFALKVKKEKKTPDELLEWIKQCLNIH